MPNPRPNPPSRSGTCQDPRNGPFVGGRRLDNAEEALTLTEDIEQPTEDIEQRRADAKAYMPAPRECNDSRDCRGKGVYCYEGQYGRPNYCKRGDGEGSLCQSDEGCGWIGDYYNGAWMYCQMVEYRRADGMMMPNPRP